MKLTKNFCWYTFQKAAMNRQDSFVTDGFKYDIIYVGHDGYMMANKRKATAEDITVEETTQNHPDWTPLILEDGQYKPLPQRGQNK